ncbi:MAG: M28 family peptidase [Acidobacteria bacterium]|nr:M28 family peptidase [Acidobacteriota bacterium]
MSKNLRSRTIGMLITVLAMAIAVAAQGTATRSAYSADEYRAFVQKMSSSADNEARVKFVTDELKKLNIRVSTEGFSQKGRGDAMINGTNVLAEIPNKDAKKTILIGAHLDKVNVGIGALDNASGTAAVFALLKAFKASPLKNYRLQAAFWDAEERGLVGSRVYVNDRKDKEGRLPDIYINFDIFGKGDSLWLYSTNDESEFVKGLKASAEKFNFAYLIGPEYPASDHRSFAASVESYSFSLLPNGEPANIVRMLKGEKLEEKDFPNVMKTIHTANDSMETIDAESVARSLPVVEAAIRSLDK